MQSKRHSFIETSVNMIGGMLLGIFIVQPLALGLYGIEISLQTSTELAIIFTAVSFIRGYVVRRIFNKLTIKAYNEDRN